MQKKKEGKHSYGGLFVEIIGRPPCRPFQIPPQADACSVSSLGLSGTHLFACPCKTVRLRMHMKCY